jgi:two-component system, chemotaxis family, response regulator PixG
MPFDVQRSSSASSILTIDEVVAHLQSVQRSQFTGRLDLLGNKGQSWMLHFRLGRLIWANSEKHRFRRWQRCMKHFCPEVALESVRLREIEIPECVEYVMLSVIVKRGHILRENAIAIIQQVIQEVIFDICCNLQTITDISVANEKSDIRGDALVLLNGEQYLNRGVVLWQTWCHLGLALYSPNLALHIKNADMLKSKASASTYRRLLGYIEESATLWDMAMSLKKDVVTVAQLLAPYLTKGMMGLKEISDLPPPSFSKQIPKPLVADSDCPVVVCVDDSKVHCEQMAEILGTKYRFIAVSDSVQALPTLLSNKPDIIFLDLVMPVANGYEICAQIRRVSALKEIPIVILTGKDGIIDRVRAKMAGANDFLGKPVDPQMILDILSRYLDKPKVSVKDRAYEMGDTTEFTIRQTLAASD